MTLVKRSEQSKSIDLSSLLLFIVMAVYWITVKRCVNPILFCYVSRVMDVNYMFDT